MVQDRGPQERVKNHTEEQLVEDTDRVVFPFWSISWWWPYAPQSGEIVGILKQLKDETTIDLNALEKEELDRKTIRDVIELLHDDDNLELFKKNLPSRTPMQLQSDEREVASRVRAVARNSPGSPRFNLISRAFNS